MKTKEKTTTLLVCLCVVWPISFSLSLLVSSLSLSGYLAFSRSVGRSVGSGRFGCVECPGRVGSGRVESRIRRSWARLGEVVDAELVAEERAQCLVVVVLPLLHDVDARSE